MGTRGRQRPTHSREAPSNWRTHERRRVAGSSVIAPWHYSSRQPKRADHAWRRSLPSSVVEDVMNLAILDMILTNWVALSFVHT